MVGWIRSAGGAGLVAVIGVLVAACGGQSHSVADDEPGTGATGGSNASGGVGASGGTGGTGGTGAGSGGTGGTGGTGVALPVGCIMNGIRYAVGETFPAGDGCNTCTCQAPDTVVCTRTACVTCDSVGASFDDAMLEARRCDPGLSSIQCGELVSNGLNCGCPTFVHTSDPVTSVQDQWTSLSCSQGVTCGACPPSPIRGLCAAEGVMEGFCVDVFEETPEP